MTEYYFSFHCQSACKDKNTSNIKYPIKSGYFEMCFHKIYMLYPLFSQE